MKRDKTTIPKSTRAILARIERQFASGSGRASSYWTWEGLIAIKRLAAHNPTALWRLIARWGNDPNDSVRDDVGDWLNALLSTTASYDRFIARAEKLAVRKPRFGALLLASLEFVQPYFRAAEIKEAKRRLRATGVNKPVKRRPSLDEILEPGNILFGAELFDRILARRRWTAGERVVYRVHVVGQQVTGDGFDGFFYNTAIRDITATPAALRRIGANRTARDIERAIGLYGSGGIPRHRGMRVSQLEELDGARRRTLRSLERHFPRDNLDVLLRTYVSQHPEEFPD